MTESFRLWPIGEDASRGPGAGDLASSPPSRRQSGQRKRRWQVAGSVLVVVTMAGGIWVTEVMRNDRTGVAPAGPPAGRRGDSPAGYARDGFRRGTGVDRHRMAAGRVHHQRSHDHRS
jgi:hypothetical protein